jgi:Lrp/AsnC family transcriptional regulator, leucine-responsive regulatory protein
MLDDFDLKLLNLVQRDDARTAESLAEEVPLSSSAISRRLRRLRSDGWIARSIALLSEKLTRGRLQAVVFVQLDSHSDLRAKSGLEESLLQSDRVQLCYEIAGADDFIVLFDCHDMADFRTHAEDMLASDPRVRRYETHIVKRRVKFVPFIDLLGRS